MTGFNYNQVWNQTFQNLNPGSPQSAGWGMDAGVTKRYEPSGQSGGMATGFPTDVVTFRQDTGTAGALAWLLFGPYSDGGTTVHGFPGPPPYNTGDRYRLYCCAAASTINEIGFPDTGGMTQPSMWALQGGNHYPITAHDPAAPPAKPIPWTDYPIVGNTNSRSGATTFPIMWEHTNTKSSLNNGLYMVFQGYNKQRAIAVSPYTLWVSSAAAGEIQPPGPVNNLAVTQSNTGPNITITLTWDEPTIQDTGNGSFLGGYNIYRSQFTPPQPPTWGWDINNTPTQGQGRTLITTISSGGIWEDTDVKPLNIYTYWVCPIEAGATKPAGLGAADWEGCAASIRVNVEIPADDQPPSAPVNLRVEPGSSGQGGLPPFAGAAKDLNHLMWNPATDDDARYPVQYLLRADIPASGNRTWPMDTPITATSYTLRFIDMPTTGLKMQYTVFPYDHISETIGFDLLPGYSSSRNGQPSNSLLILEPTLEWEDCNQPPSQPTNLTALSVSSESVTIRWDPSIEVAGWPTYNNQGNPVTTKGFTVKGYNVYRNGTLIQAAANQPGTSYTDDSVVAGTQYAYTVSAVDDTTPTVRFEPEYAHGLQSLQSAPLAVLATGAPPVDLPPTTPTMVHLVHVSATSAGIAWSAATDDVTVTGYNVYRDTVKLTLTPTGATSFTDPALSPETMYSYTVTALDNIGQESGHTAPLAVTTEAFGSDLPPSRPVGVFTENVYSNRVILAWPAATDDTAVTGYNVYRDAIKRTTTPTPTTRYTDSGLFPETTYSYTVTAVDNIGQESTPSDPLAVTTPATPIGGGGGGGGGSSDPTELPWDTYAELAAALAPHVASHAGLMSDDSRRATAVTQATEHVPTVATYVHGYTRGRGWEGNVPAGPLCSVIVAAAARLLTNPEQLTFYTIGDYTERPAVLTGWTLPELAVLKRYRKIAA